MEETPVSKSADGFEWWQCQDQGLSYSSKSQARGNLATGGDTHPVNWSLRAGRVFPWAGRAWKEAETLSRTRLKVIAHTHGRPTCLWSPSRHFSSGVWCWISAPSLLAQGWCLKPQPPWGAGSGSSLCCCLCSRLHPGSYSVAQCICLRLV